MAEALRLEAEKDALEARNENAALNEQIQELRRQIEEYNRQLSDDGVSVSDFSEDDDKVPVTSGEYVQPAIRPRLKLLETLRTPASEMVVDEDSIDDDQLDIIDQNISESMIVTGCAGSGKSVIAMYKAEQIAAAGHDVILIAYTKSLSAFMREGIQNKTLNYRFFYHKQWIDHKRPTADYIIVDEIQDFTPEEIREFMNAAKKCYLFFGDTSQSIYTTYKKNTVSIDELSKMTGITPLYLYNNYRLPRGVAKITQDYVGVNVDPYSEKVYQNLDKAIPYIVKLDSFEKQMDVIANIADMSSSDLFIKKSVGILVPSNEMVMDVCNALKQRDFDCEFKYTLDATEGQRFINTLDFSTRYPKVMTYHSAKGLQFDVVILPMYEGAMDNEDRKALYVAMTRTMGELYIFYSTEKLMEPLDKVKTNLYKKELPKKN